MARSIRTFSGAHLIVTDNYAAKRCSNASIQVDYMKKIGSPPFPRSVELLNEESYCMEVLQPLPKIVKNQFLYLKHLTEILQKYFWRNGHPGSSNWKHEFHKWLTDYVCYDVLGILTWADEVIARQYPSRYIHGDPTFSNVMLRDSKRTWKEWVLIDPIPAGGKIPPHIYVDIGKILQSCLGWEDKIDIGWDKAFKHLTKDMSLCETDTTLFWTVIHLYRILPYARSIKDQKTFDWVIQKIEFLKNFRQTFQKENAGGFN